MIQAWEPNHRELDEWGKLTVWKMSHFVKRMRCPQGVIKLDKNQYPEEREILKLNWRCPNWDHSSRLSVEISKTTECRVVAESVDNVKSKRPVGGGESLMSRKDIIYRFNYFYEKNFFLEIVMSIIVFGIFLHVNSFVFFFYIHLVQSCFWPNLDEMINFYCSVDSRMLDWRFLLSPFSIFLFFSTATYILSMRSPFTLSTSRTIPMSSSEVCVFYTTENCSITELTNRNIIFLPVPILKSLAIPPGSWITVGLHQISEKQGMLLHLFS